MIRMHINDKNVKYDINHDVLHVFFRPYTPSYDDEEFPGIIVKRDELDERVTGLVVLDFMKRSSKELRTLLPKYELGSLQDKYRKNKL